MRRKNLGLSRKELWRLLELINSSEDLGEKDAKLQDKLSKAFEKFNEEVGDGRRN